MNLKILRLVCLVTLFGMAITINAQDADSTSNKKIADSSVVFSEKEKKAELRRKACGTTSVNYKVKTDKKQRPMPDAPSDKALIYVMRTTMLGFKIHSKLAANGDWMGVNRGGTYFFFELEPGEHFFCSESENQDYLALTVEAGKIYYLKQRVEPGVWKARTDLAVIEEGKAKKELGKLYLSVFDLK